MEKKPKIITKPIIKKIMHNNKIMKENEQKKKKMSNDFNFSNLWPMSWDHKRCKWKNVKLMEKCEAKSLSNQVSKDKIKKNQLYKRI